MEKTIGILTFEQFQKRENIGSSRIRVKWPLKHWPEAEEFVMGKKYDVMIYQKAYWLEHMQKFQGIKILDICDADWLHWGYRISQCLSHCDAVTTSTVAIAKYLVNLIYALKLDIPVCCIPDRLDLESFGNLKKDHTGRGIAKVVAWYGYSENFPILEGAVGSLIKAGIEELVVIAGRRSPFKLPASMEGKIRLSNLPWTAETCNRDLLKADIVLNPQGRSGRWKYKSNNKTINAWALGLPVAKDNVDLAKFMEEKNRIAEGEMRYKEMREKYDIRETVKEYRDLISLLKEKKQNVHQ